MTYHIEKTSGYCRLCNRYSLFESIQNKMTPMEYMGHSLLTVMTCGLWGIAFLIRWVMLEKKQPFRCSTCGSPLH